MPLALKIYLFYFKWQTFGYFVVTTEPYSNRYSLDDLVNFSETIALI